MNSYRVLSLFVLQISLGLAIPWRASAQSSGGSQSYTPRPFTPPVYTPPTYTPPAYTPPTYTPPPAYKPRVYTPPTYTPPPAYTPPAVSTLSSQGDGSSVQEEIRAKIQGNNQKADEAIRNIQRTGDEVRQKIL